MIGQQWTRLPRGLTLSHTLECRLNIDTFLETLTHTLTTKTNYAWDDLGDLDGMPYLPTSNGNVLKGFGRNAIALANGFVAGDLWEGGHFCLLYTSDAADE